MTGFVQSSVHVREDADDRVFEYVRGVDVRAGSVTESRSLDGLETAFRLDEEQRLVSPRAGGTARTHLRCNHLVLVAELKRKLVHERDIDRLEKLRQDDAPTLAHEHLQASLALVIRLHVQVRQDSRSDWRVAEHLRDSGTRSVRDLAEECLLVVQDDAGDRVLAGDAEKRLPRLVEYLESCREGRRRREEGGTEGREMRLDESVGFDASMRGDLRDLKLGERLDKAVAVAEQAEQSSESLAFEKTLRFGGPARRDIGQ